MYRKPGDADDDATIERTVREMTAAIARELGLPASAGIATSKPMAKVANVLGMTLRRPPISSFMSKLWWQAWLSEPAPRNKHALKNALIPILTVIGLTAALLISGAVVTETVFGLPGVGSLVVSAVLRRDYPVIQGALLVIAGLYVLVNFAIDMLYLAVDPRVRY